LVVQVCTKCYFLIFFLVFLVANQKAHSYKLYKCRNSNVSVNFLLVELSLYGAVYQTLSVLLVLLFLRDVLELLIFMSF